MLRKGDNLARMGRPKKDPADKVRNQLIAIDYTDYKKIKVVAENNNTEIKVVVKNLVKTL